MFILCGFASSLLGDEHCPASDKSFSFCVSDFSTSLSCRPDTGAVDVVFVIDTTSSMGWAIDSVRKYIHTFVRDLSIRRYDFRLGGVAFGDGVRVWDFNLSTPGNQMTADTFQFIFRLYTTPAWQGLDFDETSWDALYQAITNYDWRTDALHIVILFTDAGFCATDYVNDNDGLPYMDTICTNGVVDNFWPYFTMDTMYCCEQMTAIDTITPYNLAITSGTVVFCVTSIGIDARSLSFYQRVSMNTGGLWYNLSLPGTWSSLFTRVTSLIYVSATIRITVRNTTGVTINPLSATLIPTNSACLSLLTGATINSISPVAPGEEYTFIWNVNLDSTCAEINKCFDIILSGGGYSDTVYGCAINDSCNVIICSPADVWIECPLPCWQFTSCPNQGVIFGMRDTTGDLIDTQRVYFTVTVHHRAGFVDTLRISEPSAYIYFAGDTMATVMVDYSDGDSVVVTLDSLFTVGGCKTVP